MRRRMTLRRPTSAALALLLLAVLAVLSGCENTRENNAGREGLPAEIGHLEYNVFISRQLNLQDVEDRGYYDGPEARPGLRSTSASSSRRATRTLRSTRRTGSPPATSRSRTRRATSSRPVALGKDNDFAYKARPLKQNACIPKEGTLASSAPTGGSLLLFELPLEALENRPLNLIITSPPIGPEQERETGRVELDA